jgi:O-antigen ligase/polysaccharide polymerase Wzy-like membrane protein
VPPAAGELSPRRLLDLLRRSDLQAALAVTALLLAFAFNDGGYFPTAWNVGTLALLWLAVVVLLVRRDVVLGRFDAAVLVGFAALSVWTALSAAWSIAPPTSLLDGQRTLLYLAGVGALLLLFSRGDARAAAIAVTASATIVCAYSLLDRLVAVNPLPYYRLGGPLGYWNALGVLAAAGVCLAVALIAHERRRAVRAAAGCAVPILIGALYLTFSRGSWVALVLGLGVTAATGLRRRELAGAALAVALPSAVVVGCGALADALTTPLAQQAAVEADAHRFAIAIVLASAGSAALAILAPRFGARLPSFSFRRSAAATVLCGIVIAVVVAGGPGSLVGGAARAFDAPPPDSSTGLNMHVVSLSGSVRGQLWEAAVRSFADRPLAGSGAGTYSRLWLIQREEAVTMRDAHSLYLETLAELGVAGLILLLALLAIPLVAARRVLTTRYVPPLVGTYIALLSHAAIDWDWEMPVVVFAALVCGAAIVASARGTPRPLGRRVRLGATSLAVALAGCALVLLIGNRRLDSAADAANTGSPALESRAHTAERWVPWSPDPPRWLAAAQLRRGNRAEARRLLRKALRRDSTDWSLWVEMAVASDGSARRRAITEAVRLNPRGSEVFNAALQAGLLPRSRTR